MVNNEEKFQKICFTFMRKFSLLMSAFNFPHKGTTGIAR